MSETSNDKRICDLFTKDSHHHNLSVICLVQNLYYQGKESCTMSLNSQYLVLFNNPLGKATGLGLGKTDVPRTERKVFKHLQNGYLLTDLKPDTPK